MKAAIDAYPLASDFTDQALQFAGFAGFAHRFGAGHIPIEHKVGQGFLHIRNIHTDAVTIFGDKVFDKDGKEITINTTKVNEELAKLETEYTNNKYQRDRADSYPSIQDQLDMQYWDKVNSTTTWQTAIAKVKSDNPKG